MTWRVRTVETGTTILIEESVFSHKPSSVEELLTHPGMDNVNAARILLEEGEVGLAGPRHLTLTLKEDRTMKTGIWIVECYDDPDGIIIALDYPDTSLHRSVLFQSQC